MWTDSIRTILYQFALPVFIVTITLVLLPRASHLPETAVDLFNWLPVSLAALATLLAMVFNQSLAAVVGLSLVCGFGLLVSAPGLAPDQPFLAALMYGAYCTLLPANVLVAALLKDRGVLRITVALSVLLALEAVLLTAAARWAQEPLASLLATEFVDVPFTTQIPQIGLAMLTATAVTATWRHLRKPTSSSAGVLAALLPLALAAHWINRPLGVEIAVLAGALILLTCMIAEAHRIAFRDDLTGLRGRRALNLRLGTMGRCYTAAMLDVDHFKKFNDSYGHDAGDDVLRLVASKLRRVGGGGVAYRYGGEEFTILFGNQTADHALPYLEELRQAIADYPMTLRGKQRPNNDKAGRRLRGKKTRKRPVYVTVSIGVAESNRNGDRAVDVLKAADEALYKAKHSGRNRVVAAR